MNHIGMTLFVVLLGVPAYAARGGDDTGSAGGRKLHLGVDGALVLPVGDWGDVAGIGIGPLGKVEYDLRPEIALTGRLGFIIHMAKTQDLPGSAELKTRTLEIPIMPGVKYYFQPGSQRPYAAAELGLVDVAASVNGTWDSEIKIGMTLGGGYQMGRFDFRGQFLLPSLGDVGDLFGIMVTVGYALADVPI